MSYSKSYHPQVKGTLPDPDSKGHTLERGDWVFWKHRQRKTILEGTFPRAPDPDSAAKLGGTEPWVRISQPRKVPQDI